MYGYDCRSEDRVLRCRFCRLLYDIPAGDDPRGLFCADCRRELTAAWSDEVSS